MESTPLNLTICSKDATPTPSNSSSCQDSGFVSGSSSSASLDASKFQLCHSTPNIHSLTSRKRKSSSQTIADSQRTRPKRAEGAPESYPSTPQASSTLNESLICNLEKCNIGDINRTPGEVSIPIDCDSKSDSACILYSVPTTPQKQIISTNHCERKSTGPCRVKPLARIAESPLNEKQGILYPELRPVSAQKSLLSPYKLREATRTPPRRCLVKKSATALQKVIANTLIMGKIFRCLSDGDLYRLYKVSNGFMKAIKTDASACVRYKVFVEQNKKNKENYQITPPGSPEKVDLTPPVSPGSKQFYDFLMTAKELDTNQTQVKCVYCGGPAVVTHNIAQCIKVHSCGYIFCRLCGSFSSTGPEDFTDSCGKGILANTLERKLNDLTNYNISPILHSTDAQDLNSSAMNTSSETVESVVSVKRNLSSTFMAADGDEGRRVFSMNGTNKQVISRPARLLRRRSSLLAVNVGSGEGKRSSADIMEPSSPPKVRESAICSKSSRKNLKRLTR